MTWIQTFTGKKFDLLNPTAKMVDIEDIAHALSLINRFAGHTTVPYSVAQHSYFVSLLCPPEFALEGLLHDAHEAYTGDISSPMSAAMIKGDFLKLGQTIPHKEIAIRVNRAIATKFNADFNELYRRGDPDHALLVLEAKMLFQHRPIDHWTKQYLDAYGKMDMNKVQLIREKMRNHVLSPQHWSYWKFQFLKIFQCLWSERVKTIEANIADDVDRMGRCGG